MRGLADEACNHELASGGTAAVNNTLGPRIEKKSESRRIRSRMSHLCQKSSFWVQQEQ